MKKLLYFSLLFIASCGCFSDIKTNDFINKAKKPIIVMAIAKETNECWGTIILKDANGVVGTFRSSDAAANALIETFKINDTIK